jgi:WD40 repeat protein
MQAIFVNMWTIEKIGQARGHAGPVYALCKGRSENTVLTASGDRFIAEWDVQSWTASPFSIKLEAAAFSMCLLKEINQLAVGQSEGGIHVINLVNKVEWKHLVLHEKGVFCFHHLKESSMVLTGGGDGTLAMWSLPDWKLLRSFQLADGKIRHITKIAEDRIAVSSSDGTITILDLPLLNTLHRFDAHQGGTNCSMMLAHKPVLVSGGKDGHIRLWKVDEQFKPLLAIPAHNYGIYSLAMNQDGTCLASASRDSTIKLWDTSDFGKPLRVNRPAYDTHTHSVNALWWDHESGILCSTGDDRKIIGWRVSKQS